MNARFERKKLVEKKDMDKVIYLTADYTEKTPEGEVLDSLNLKKICCRRHVLTHVDIE